MLMPTSDHEPRSFTRPAIVVGILLLLYVLSYAPVYRLGKPLGFSRIDQPSTIYRPVEWMIDNTPLAEPLFRWANCWGVRGDVVWSAAARAFSRGEAGAITISPDAETPHFYEHVITPDDAG